MVAGAAETRAEEIAQRIADILIEGFDRHYRLFRESSADAKQRFEIGLGRRHKQAVKERIRFYDDRVRECVERLHDELDAGALDDATWRRAKLYYIGLLVDHRRPELAETFFNSVVTRVLQRTYVHNDFAFVRAAISTEYIESDPPIYRSYYPPRRASGRPCSRSSPISAGAGPLPTSSGTSASSGRRCSSTSAASGRPASRTTRCRCSARRSTGTRPPTSSEDDQRQHEDPFAIPVLHAADGRLDVDTVLLDSGRICLLFSLSRAYFMVDMDVPSGYVQFLQTIMPAKSRSDLYTMVGLRSRGRPSSTAT